VEEVVEAGLFEAGVLLVDFGKNDGVGWNVLGELSLVLLPVIVYLRSKSSCELGGRGEGEDVGVVGKSEHLLVSGSLVVGGRADSHDLASLDVGELQLEGKSVPVVTSAVGELEFVSVFIEIVNAQDLGDNIEVFAG
jgi:hypothetical protein